MRPILKRPDILLGQKYIQHYTVDEHDIGSVSENQAMEIYESEFGDPEIVQLLHMLRFGDPHWYSMWFAHAWAWWYVKQLEQINQTEFDFYSFFSARFVVVSACPHERAH